ncbi:MAG: 16S rRNA (guanine(527)-N(7))-methyltransferase RsmG [Endomicrobium sp.]|jgi:16S rRNA (guanine527-N7)-methyltransferase|nr:16S rRNA (guanine(527)-N(7))-methyltransferase RsmG [Endomicrobium sp.]
MNKLKLFELFYNYAVSNIITDFTRKQCEQFEIYYEELIEWNKMFNLISFKSENDLIYRHFCDSLYGAKAIKEEVSSTNKLEVADLGTGSGLPGIPVKIAIPEIKLTLIESITKKCKFLENVNKKLGFSIEILNERAEEVGQNADHRQKYDIVLSRAVSKFSPNLEISIPLLKIGGYFIVYKTKNSAQSKEEGIPSIENALRHLGAKLEHVMPYNLPEQNLDYCILIFKKYKDTPMQFPRKPGIPEKKPL